MSKIPKFNLGFVDEKIYKRKENKMKFNFITNLIECNYKLDCLDYGFRKFRSLKTANMQDQLMGKKCIIDLLKRHGGHINECR